MIDRLSNVRRRFIDGKDVLVEPSEGMLEALKYYEWSEKIMKNGDWEQLTKEQQKDVEALRDRMNRHLIAETEAFYAQHPELKLHWDCNVEALIRDNLVDNIVI